MSSLFSQLRVRILTSSDFELDSSEKLTMKDKSCALVLFHTADDKSKFLADVWTKLSTTVPGVVFMSCDLMMQESISTAFSEVSQNINSPLSWLNLKKVPLILEYRGGYPQAAYNGVISESALISYVTNMVCSADHRDIKILPEPTPLPPPMVEEPEKNVDGHVRKKKSNK